MIGSVFDLLPLIFLLFLISVFTGVLPFPYGFERGKVKWIMWCGTGAHFHTVYWTPDHGFQSLHPSDRGERA